MVTAVVIIVGRAALVRAAPDALPLAYDAPAECPSGDVFAAEVRARAPRSASLGTSSLVVTITAAWEPGGEGRFEGRVMLRDGNGSAPSRAVRADSCAEVVRALALAVAMTFDPDESPAEATVDAGAVPPPERVRETPAPAPASLHFRAGVRAGVESGVGPLLAPALGGFVELDARRLSLRVGVAHAASPTVERSVGAAGFGRTTGMVDACPLRWRAGSVASAACAAFEVGTLTSTGRDTISPESTTRPWIAAGVAGRLAWEPLARLVIEVEGRGSFPLVRDRFVFRPSEEVFETPILAFSAALTAGVRFP